MPLKGALCSWTIPGVRLPDRRCSSAAHESCLKSYFMSSGLWRGGRQEQRSIENCRLISLRDLHLGDYFWTENKSVGPSQRWFPVSSSRLAAVQLGSVLTRTVTLAKMLKAPTLSGLNELSYRNQLPATMEREGGWQLVALMLPA